MNRKKFISALALGLVATKYSFGNSQAPVANAEVFTLPKLPYAYGALEPFIDVKTMEIHHSKHHQAYVTNLNKALEGIDSSKLSLEKLMSKISKYSTAVRNNGGGHWNHSFFWSIMTPKKNQPSDKLISRINKDFGSIEKLKEEFTKAATGQFGSGWAWVIVQKKKLKVVSTPNQDNPLMDVVKEKGSPILGIDVWEHAYYLKYQNKRADYVNAFWNLIDWEQVEKNYNKA